MPRRRPLAACAVLLCALAFAPAAVASPSHTMLAKVNAYRAAHGVPRLHNTRALDSSARRYARWMLHHQYFGHDNHIHVSQRFRYVGEVLAYHTGEFPAVGLMLRAWEHSREHNAILLDRTYVDAGFGFVEGRLHGKRVTLWVGHLARR